MSDKQIIWGLSAVMIVLLGVGGYIVKMFLSDDSPRKKNRIAAVTLIRPPPITEKEKPPEREPVKDIPKKEEIIDRKKEEIIDGERDEIIDSSPSKEPQNEDSDNAPAKNTPALANDNTPAENTSGVGDDTTPVGDTLGLDAEGTAGSDAFGLVAKKGGRSILAGRGGSGRAGTGGSGKVGGGGSGKAAAGGSVRIGGGGSGKAGGSGFEKVSLLNKFGWYTQIVKAEISKKIQKHLDHNEEIPRGKFQTVLRISVDSTGAVVQCQIIDSSGNPEMDETIKQSLGYIRLSEPPPKGMPQTMIIRVTSQSS